MILNVATATGNVMLNSVAGLLEGAHLELLTDGGALLVELGLFDADAAVDGELVFQVAPGTAIASGDAAFARAVGADGSEVFSCDITDERGDGVIKLNTTKIYRDTSVKLTSFRLIMP